MKPRHKVMLLLTLQIAELPFEPRQPGTEVHTLNHCIILLLMKE